MGQPTSVCKLSQSINIDLYGARSVDVINPDSNAKCGQACICAYPCPCIPRIMDFTYNSIYIYTYKIMYIHLVKCKLTLFKHGLSGEIEGMLS